ncbi:arylamine N-acetyltransferase [Cupriavidus sp. 2TAF22]|uniref:arylamine N-acetyltransferase family protein n=1 Tax=unclassified Cupriavidus TaxID=2640874 RepID=UPI003F91348A
MTAADTLNTPDAPDALDATRLQAYLDRIGHPLPAAADRAALDSLIAAHLARIPFENIDVLLQRPVRIGVDAVFDKLVGRRRGGYCFEHNTLLAAALRALGYAVTLLAARVRWNVPDDVPTMQSHMLLRVEAAHLSHIVDAGFGGPTPYRALPLPPAGDADPAFPYRLNLVDDSASAAFHLYDMEVRGADGWFRIYRFDLSPQQAIDYEARNWYTSTHPDSLFRQALCVARSQVDTRMTLLNDEFAVRATDGSVHRQRLDSPDKIIEVLAERFGLALEHADAQALKAILPALLQAQRAD